MSGHKLRTLKPHAAPPVLNSLHSFLFSLVFCFFFSFCNNCNLTLTSALVWQSPPAWRARRLRWTCNTSCRSCFVQGSNMLHHLRFIEWVLHSKAVIVITSIQLPGSEKRRHICIWVSSYNVAAEELKNNFVVATLEFFASGCQNTAASVNLTKQLHRFRIQSLQVYPQIFGSGFILDDLHSTGQIHEGCSCDRSWRHGAVHWRENQLALGW